MPESRVGPELRALVTQRAGNCCEYCRSPLSHAIQPFSIEHIMPRSRGGATVFDNLALSCQGCNNHKYQKVSATDPVSGEVVALYHPRRDVWADHFAWNENCSILIGLTAIGRATITTLMLNRSGVVNLRSLLFAAGLHPPPVPPEDLSR